MAKAAVLRNGRVMTDAVRGAVAVAGAGAVAVRKVVIAPLLWLIVAVAVAVAVAAGASANGDANDYKFRSGCLVEKRRTCTHRDEPGSPYCSQPGRHLQRPEIKIYAGDWDSALIMSWVIQIIGTEYLNIPITVFSLTKQNQAVHLNFWEQTGNATSPTEVLPRKPYCWDCLARANALGYGGNNQCIQETGNS